ncbi:MAG: hypothetical protein R3A47_12665, partial [Polyangiales bacterium]
MMLAAITLSLSVALGWVLATVPRATRFAVVFQTFAVVSAVVLVVGRIIPEAVAHVGLWSLVVMA